MAGVHVSKDVMFMSTMQMECLLKVLVLDFESRQQAFYHLFSTTERCAMKKSKDFKSEKDL